MFPPDPLPEAEFYLSAFNTLGSDRQMGGMGGLGPIPWSSIHRYAHAYGIEALVEFERLVRMIRSMDAMFMDFQNEKLKAAAKPKT